MATTITIELEIVGRAADARYAVNKVLDTGILQDAIKAHGLLRVTSATCHVKPAEMAKKSRRTRRS